MQYLPVHSSCMHCRMSQQCEKLCGNPLVELESVNYTNKYIAGGGICSKAHNNSPKDMMAAAKAASSDRDISWLNSDIEYETLTTSLSVSFSATRQKTSAIVYRAQEVGGNRLLMVKRYEPIQGARGTLLKRFIENERQINAAVRGGVSLPTRNDSFTMPSPTTRTLMLTSILRGPTNWVNSLISFLPEIRFGTSGRQGWKCTWNTIRTVFSNGCHLRLEIEKFAVCQPPIPA